MVERIVDANGKILAIIVKSGFQKDGIQFFTPDDFSQQLAYMKHPAGKYIMPHIHNQVERTVLYTKEVLVIKKGRIRVDFYNDAKEYQKSTELSDGDVILLAAGGHGFKVIEDIEMYEIKQGPYAGENDKTRFQGIDSE